jgi:hypothetical protein
MDFTTTWADRTAELRTTDGVPERLLWHAREYRVTDEPTRIEDALGTLLTHPLPVRGWRFQGTSDAAAETLVFDLLWCDGGWRVVRTYR